MVSSTKVRIIIFNVDRGNCTFINSPNHYALLIDCAQSEKFSPILRINNSEMGDIIQFEGHNLAFFILSHPHDDHLSDVNRLRTQLRPQIISGMENDLEDIKDPDIPDNEYTNLNDYIKWRPTYKPPVLKWPDWGMKLKHSFGLSIDEAKEVSKNPKQWPNNASIPVTIEYKGNKIFFPGDIMEEAWEILLQKKTFVDAIKDTTFFVASHHGLKSGYHSGIFDEIKPKVVLVSERPGETIHSVYSSSDNVVGIPFGKETRYMISTKTGSIFLEFYEDRSYEIAQHTLPDNIED